MDYSYGWLKARQACVSSVWWATEGLRRVPMQDDESGGSLLCGWDEAGRGSAEANGAPASIQSITMCFGLSNLSF